MLAFRKTIRSFARFFYNGFRRFYDGFCLIVMPDLIGHLFLRHLDGDGFEADAVGPDVEVVVGDEEEFIAGIGAHHAQPGERAALAAFEFGVQPAEAPAQFHAGLVEVHAEFPAHLVEQQASFRQGHFALMERHLAVRRMDGGLAVRIGRGHQFGRERAQIRHVHPVVLHDEFLDALGKNTDFHLFPTLFSQLAKVIKNPFPFLL